MRVETEVTNSSVFMFCANISLVNYNLQSCLVIGPL